MWASRVEETSISQLGRDNANGKKYPNQEIFLDCSYCKLSPSNNNQQCMLSPSNYNQQCMFSLINHDQQCMLSPSNYNQHCMLSPSN